jgi:large-conductance mechanosensitive channel
VPAKKKRTEANETHVVTTSAGNVHISQPKGSSRRKQPKITVLVSSEEAVKGSVHGFVGFLRERAIIGLAVGFVVATQVQGVIKQLIASFIDPLTQLLFSQKLSARTFTLHYHGRQADFAWGQFVYVMIYFLVVVIVIYAIIKLFKLDKLDKKSD